MSYPVLIGYHPRSHPSKGCAKLEILEDNDAVIKSTINGRSPELRHVPRVHRVDLDWLWERIRIDPGISIKHVVTKLQIADMLTKANFQANNGGYYADWLSVVITIQLDWNPYIMA